MQRIAIATDLEPHDAQTFATALRLARASGATLKVLHVHGEDRPADWKKLPTVRDLLEKWGMLQRDATVEDFQKLGVSVQPVDRATPGDFVRELVVRIEEAQPDLLIVGTEGRSGMQQLMRPSVAEPVSRDWGGPTLVLSRKSRPIVRHDGTLNLRRVLVPIDLRTEPQGVVDTLCGILDDLGAGHVTFVLFHVGDIEQIPPCELPRRTDWMWRTELAKGNVVEGILAAADVHHCDLLVMGTHGHDSWLDALRGSTTEQVLRRSPCAVLVVPVK